MDKQSTRRAGACVAAAAALALAGAGAARADSLRAYAGVVAGNAVIGSNFACATSGPTIRDGWFAGLNLPTEGIAACGLAGGVDDKIAASGPQTSSFSASGPMASHGTFSGTARARADYWSLGVAASGSATGDSSSQTYRQAAGFASFTQSVTYSKPGIATGTPGSTDFSFAIDGLMSSLAVAPYTQQGDFKLQFRVNGQYVWDTVRATVLSDGVPYLRGGSSGLPGSFVSGPGTLSGSATVTSTANFPILWGVPFTLEVVMIADVSPCCNGTSLDVDFYNSATLAGIVAYAPGGRVDDFDVFTATGPRVGPGGILAVPEPQTAALMALGLAALWAARRRGSLVKGVTLQRPPRSPSS